MSDIANGEEFGQRIFDVESMTAEDRLEAAEEIARIVEARGLKVTSLAHEAGVDRKTLRTLLSGARAPQADVLRKVIEALNLPQRGDFDERFSARTRAFVSSIAPIFDQLPEDAKDEAQHDVTVLLTGKLARAVGNDGVLHNLADYRRRNVSAVPNTDEADEAAAAFKAEKLTREDDDSEFF